MPVMSASIRRLRLAATVLIMVLILTLTFYHQKNNTHHQYCLGTDQHKLPEMPVVDSIEPMYLTAIRP